MLVSDGILVYTKQSRSDCSRSPLRFMPELPSFLYIVEFLVKHRHMRLPRPHFSAHSVGGPVH